MYNIRPKATPDLNRIQLADKALCCWAAMSSGCILPTLCLYTPSLSSLCPISTIYDHYSLYTAIINGLSPFFADIRDYARYLMKQEGTAEKDLLLRLLLVDGLSCGRTTGSRFAIGLIFRPPRLLVLFELLEGVIRRSQEDAVRDREWWRQGGWEMGDPP